MIEEINIDADNLRGDSLRRDSTGQVSQSLTLEGVSGLKNFAGANSGQACEIWGRSYRDAPDVDGRICAEGLLNDRIKLLKPGDKVKIKIQECVGNDLFGELI